MNIVVWKSMAWWSHYLIYVFITIHLHLITKKRIMLKVIKNIWLENFKVCFCCFVRLCSKTSAEKFLTYRRCHLCSCIRFRRNDRIQKGFCMSLGPDLFALKYKYWSFSSPWNRKAFLSSHGRTIFFHTPKLKPLDNGHDLITSSQTHNCPVLGWCFLHITKKILN